MPGKSVRKTDCLALMPGTRRASYTGYSSPSRYQTDIKQSRAEKRDTDSKVLALPSELGNPHRTRLPTFPQQRLRRRTNLPKRQNPPKSQGLTDSCAEPEKEVSRGRV